MLTGSGYIPADGSGRRAELLLTQMESLDQFFTGGGNLFIFPEGTRSRNHRLGPLNLGAFKIALRHQVPLRMIAIVNTERMFTPGRFAFNTRGTDTICLRLAGSLPPGSGDRPADLAHQARRLLQTALDRSPSP